MTERSPAEQSEARRRGRNYAIGAVLLALVALFYMLTIVRIGGAR